MYKINFTIILLLLSYIAVAQQIKGIVIDENQNALEGAHVICSNVNAISLADGSFTINLADTQKGEVQISYMGYKTQRFPFNFKSDSVIDLGSIRMLITQFSTEEVCVVVVRSSRINMEVPADINVISDRQMKLIPSDKIDQNLKFTSGVYVDRPFGIFGKSVVGLRSIVGSEPGRQLTLVDGVPINKSDGGGTNWNRLIETDFQRIEVLKGPGAAIYGNNAMGGIINLVHKRPHAKGIKTMVNTSYSTYNTLNADISLMHKLNEGEKSWYYTFAAKGIKSDGYITVPDSIRDETDTNVFIQEYGANARLGYNFKPLSRIEMEYNYYDEYRGQGTKILLEDGAVARYKTHFTKLNYSNYAGPLKMTMNMHYQLEEYQRDIEKMKNANYSLILVKSDRVDYGFSAMFHYAIKKHNFSFGADYSSGSVYGVDDYQTSTDNVINEGQMNVANIYLSDEWQIAKKFKSILGLQFAYGKFLNGAFSIQDPTSATSFMLANTGELDQKEWNGFSPRIALQYDFSNKMNIYAVYSHGYRAPSLDDLTRYGFINIGYKNANPNLLPENLDNVELGYRLQLKKWVFQSNVFVAKGSQFMYYVATGETIFGGKRKVYEKRNVTEVNFYGLEFNMDYVINSNWQLNANYTLNGSEISKFNDQPDLVNKKLSFVPSDLANFSVSYLVNRIKANVNIHYQGKMFLDEANTFEVKPLLSLDASVSYEFYKLFSVRLSAQNILDEQHMVSSDQMSLGRYLSLALRYGF